jgi:hypothetical protein
LRSHASGGFPGKPPPFRATADPSAPRRSRNGLARWIAILRCACLGHAWRASHSLQGYETCARCRLHRLPLH